MSVPAGFQQPVAAMSKLRFACPFAKKYGLHGTCGQSNTGNGWPTTHRVREHIKRCHGPLIKCPRCHAIFREKKELTDHQTADDACAKKQEPAGIRIRCTEEEITKLKPKRKSDVSEEEQWHKMYKILFPEDAVIPSPYINVHDNDVNQIQSAEWQLHIKAELGRELRALLVDDVPNEARFSSMRSQVQSFLINAFDTGLVQEAIDRVVNKHKRHRTSENATKPRSDTFDDVGSIGTTDDVLHNKGQDGIAGVSSQRNPKSLETMGDHESGLSQLPQLRPVTPSYQSQSSAWKSGLSPDPDTSVTAPYDYVVTEELGDTHSSQRTELLGDDWQKISSEVSGWPTTPGEPADPGEFDSQYIDWPEQSLNQNSSPSFSNVALAAGSKRRASRSPARERK